MTHDISFNRRTAMAWYALRPFINPLDCSQKVGSAWLPMNKSEALETLYNRVPSGDGRPYRPSYFGKTRLFFHLSRAETYGFRCRYDAVAQLGFGSHDGARDQLDFAADLGIEGRLRRFTEVGVILLGIDIDAHHGEEDAPIVRDMLLDLFPSSYWEPSTGGKGFHFYLKLAYPRRHAGGSADTLRYVHRVMADLGNLLERRRVDAGLKAKTQSTA